MRGINKGFIRKDDDWGIIQSLKEIYGFEEPKEEFEFSVFVNQFLPPTYYETKSTIIRHLDEIREILDHRYKKDWVWIERNNQYQCAVINDGLMSQIKDGMVRLPYYLEIEEEKKKWQATPGYQKEKGFSEPIKEEYVQLNIRSK